MCGGMPEERPKLPKDSRLPTATPRSNVLKDGDGNYWELPEPDEPSFDSSELGHALRTTPHDDPNILAGLPDPILPPNILLLRPDLNVPASDLPIRIMATFYCECSPTPNTVQGNEGWLHRCARCHNEIGMVGTGTNTHCKCMGFRSDGRLLPAPPVYRYAYEPLLDFCRRCFTFYKPEPPTLSAPSSPSYALSATDLLAKELEELRNRTWLHNCLGCYPSRDWMRAIDWSGYDDTEEMGVHKVQCPHCFDTPRLVRSFYCANPKDSSHQPHEMRVFLASEPWCSICDPDGTNTDITYSLKLGEPTDIHLAILRIRGGLQSHILRGFNPDSLSDSDKQLVSTYIRSTYRHRNQCPPGTILYDRRNGRLWGHINEDGGEAGPVDTGPQRPRRPRRKPVPPPSKAGKK